MNNEIWKDVVGFEGIYQVSNFGRVKSVSKKLKGKLSSVRTSKERILKQSILSNYNHLRVTLYDNYRVKGMLVHRLVLEAFVGKCPDGHEACHNDGNPLNNHINNLRWDTSKNNSYDTIKHGKSNRGSINGKSKLTENEVIEIKKLLKSGNLTQKEIAVKFGVSDANINMINKNKRWSHIQL